MTQTLPDQHGKPIDVSGFEPIAGQYPMPKPTPRRYGLYEFALDFEWHTGIPLAAVIAAVAIIISTVAIVITLVVR